MSQLGVESVGTDNAAEDSSFDNSQYWNEFYEEFDEDELYDWYSSVAWLTEYVADCARLIAEVRGASPQTIKVLDVGCGTSPLLFTLNEELGFKCLYGIDFCHGAIDRCHAYLAANNLNNDELSFQVMDSTDMSKFETDSFDIICDKGCLDCFVSGEGHAQIDRYLSEVARLLSDDGQFLLVPVNGADVPFLIEHGSVRRDRQASGRVTEEVACKWEQSKAFSRSCPYNPPLHLHSVTAREDKHLYIYGKRPPSRPVNTITCGQCLATYPYPVGFPATCAKCQSHLPRFALS